MSDDLFDGPGRSDTIDWEALKGHLILVKPLKKLDKVTTTFGDKDAIESDVHIPDGPEAGTVKRNGYIFPLVLQGQVKGNIGTGRMNLGRVGLATPKPGQKPAWILEDPTESDRETARRYLASEIGKSNTAEPVAAVAAASDPWGNGGSEPPF